MNKQEMNNVAKEVSIILEHIEPKLLKRIPSNIIEHLKKMGTKSNIEFKLEIGKELNEQNILEESKDLLAVIFYLYLADESEKKEIMRSWTYNENQYQEMLKEKYQIDYKKTEDKIKERKEGKSLIVQEEKENLFSKIKKFIYRIFKKIS